MEGQTEEDKKQKIDSGVSLELEIGKEDTAVTSGGGEDMGCWREHCCNDRAWGAAGLKVWSQKGADELGK